MTAHWEPTLKEDFRGGIKLGKVDTAKAPEYSIPDDLVELLTESSAANERASYTARDFSVFLPDEVGVAGQMWKIDPEEAAEFLKQFHAYTATSFDRYHQPYGRRPGPAGAFGILAPPSAARQGSRTTLFQPGSRAANRRYASTPSESGSRCEIIVAILSCSRSARSSEAGM